MPEVEERRSVFPYRLSDAKQELAVTIMLRPLKLHNRFQ